MGSTECSPDLLGRLLRSINRASECYRMTYIPGHCLGPKGEGGMNRFLRQARASRMAWHSLLANTPDARQHVITIVSLMDMVLNEIDTALLFVSRELAMRLTYGSVIGSYGICHILEALLNIEDTVEDKREDALNECSALLRSASRRAQLLKEHRIVYDTARLNPKYQPYVRREAEDIRRQTDHVSFAGLRARCHLRYPTTHIARWITMEAIVTSGIPVKGDICSVSYVLSVRSARRIVTAETPPTLVFDEKMNREDCISLTPWWTPSEDGVVYLADSSRSWFVRWDQQVVVHNDLRTKYVSVPESEVLSKGCWSWIRWRCIELRQIPFQVGWESIFEMGNALMRLHSKIGALHKKIRDSVSETGEEMNTVSCDAAREVLLHLYQEWPNFAHEFIDKNMGPTSMIKSALRTTEVDDWARQILRRTVAGVDGGSVKVTLPNEKSIVLLGNRENSSSTDLKVTPTSGGALMTKAGSEAQKASSLVDVAESSRSLRQDQIAHLVTGLKMLTVRLAIGSLKPRNDDWLRPLFWPQADNRLLGADGPGDPETQREFDEYTYEKRHRFLSQPLSHTSPGDNPERNPEPRTKNECSLNSAVDRRDRIAVQQSPALVGSISGAEGELGFTSQTDKGRPHSCEEMLITVDKEGNSEDTEVHSAYLYETRGTHLSLLLNEDDKYPKKEG